MKKIISNFWARFPRTISLRTMSLRTTLILTFLVVGALPVLIQNGVMMSAYRQNLIDSRMQEIQNQCLILSNKMTRIGYLTMEPRDPLLEMKCP
ncbi:MAG: hypothetical protein QM683_18000 [Lacrimispora sp.]